MAETSDTVLSAILNKRAEVIARQVTGDAFRKLASGSTPQEVAQELEESTERAETELNELTEKSRHQHLSDPA